MVINIKQIQFLIRNIFLMVLLVSCDNIEECYYETGEIYAKEKINNEKQERETTLFYKNGNVIISFRSQIKEKPYKNYCFGVIKKFYPDGFPLEEKISTDKGESIKPTKEEALKGFETNFDYISFGAEDTLENKYTVFRYFIKGVSLFYQDVFICSPDSLLIHAYKLDPDIHTYKIIEKDTSYNVEIDENIYSYYVPIDERHMKPIGDGKYELKVGVFFKNLGNEEDLPSPHVSFTAIIDPDEE